MKYCNICGNSFTKRGVNCDSCISRIRRFEMKKKAVLYLGGKCSKCGYDKHLAALEFHHEDPSKKDLTLGKSLNRKWESLVKELDKCVILCSNCHRIEHSKYDNTASSLMESSESAKFIE